MTLQAPNLDDRRFQQLVDEAKRQISAKCPEWTDHNVSDPGVTLIELFAEMVDQLIYRLNRVPDRHYIKFLDLLGVRLHPPAAAKADVTFWLSAPMSETLHIPIGTQVATQRTEHEEAVNFSVTKPLDIVPCEFEAVAVTLYGAQVEDHTGDLVSGRPFVCFDDPPKLNDAIFIGLNVAVPRCAVALRFESPVAGVGVVTENPPLQWDYWSGSGWKPCEVESDKTGGFNKSGEIILHVGEDHVTSSVLPGRTGGWLRCQVVKPGEGQSPYIDPPKIGAISAYTTGGTAPVEHSDVIEGEELGRSNGMAGQRFLLAHRPVAVGHEPMSLEVDAGKGVEEWTAVNNFGDSRENHHHFVLDPVPGEIIFGPEVRDQEGKPNRYGAIPAAGARLRIPEYHVGGGTRGNVAKNRIIVLKSSIPYVTRVQNRRPAHGGAEAETVEQARARGPVSFRTMNRAVTAEDYEVLAREADSSVGRIRCIPARTPAEAGTVRLLLVPAVLIDAKLEDFWPDDSLRNRVEDYLRQRSVLGVTVHVEPPEYYGFQVSATVQAKPRALGGPLKLAALQALSQYFHPSCGGPDGTGWPFGRPVNPGDVYSLLQRLPGTEYVAEVKLLSLDAKTGEVHGEMPTIEVPPDGLVLGHGHRLTVRGMS